MNPLEQQQHHDPFNQALTDLRTTLFNNGTHNRPSNNHEQKYINEILNQLSLLDNRDILQSLRQLFDLKIRIQDLPESGRVIITSAGKQATYEIQEAQGIISQLTGISANKALDVIIFASSLDTFLYAQDYN